MLKVKRKAKEERDQKNAMAKQAMISKQQLESQQIAAQLAISKINAESEAKMKYRQADISFEIEKLKAEAELKRSLMETEFNYQMQLKGAEQSQVDNRDQKKEDAKDFRTKLQATQQSKMIEQRKRDLPSINFESNEDSLDGFDLAEFDPR